MARQITLLLFYLKTAGCLLTSSQKNPKQLKVSLTYNLVKIIVANQSLSSGLLFSMGVPKAAISITPACAVVCTIGVVIDIDDFSRCRLRQKNANDQCQYPGGHGIL